MKLINHTTRNLSILLFILISIWGIFFYFTITDEVIDETDDRLENSRDILVGRALLNPEMLSINDTIMQTYSFRKLTVEEAINYKERFYDSEIFIESEDEWEPVRIMKSAFRASDGEFYELEIRISTLERDDLIRAIFIYLIILFLVLLLFLIVGNYLILRKTFKPLHSLLDWLKEVTIGKPIPELVNDTDIIEFKELNDAAFAMSQRNKEAYQQQKEFIENASHELQTPLAITLGKVELLAGKDNLTEKQISVLDKIYSTLQRAVKLNKSLLLLSRIQNGQYPDRKKIDINNLIRQQLSELSELYEYKNIRVTFSESIQCYLSANELLMQILFNNLLKNAYIHNIAGGDIHINISENNIRIENSGESPLDPDKIFTRFYRSDNSLKEDSTGLGLSIIKSIVGLYDMTLTYSFRDYKHSFMLNFVN